MLSLYKVTVNIDNRNLEVRVKAGIIATMETGSYENNVEKLKNRLTVIVGEGKKGLAAWVQVGKTDDSNVIRMTHQGWVLEGNGQVNALSKGEPAAIASLMREVSPSNEMIDHQENVGWGDDDCCVAYGTDCYVRCCNSCCADPASCPGASCCS
jgi:hypothetical protein